MTLQTQFEFTLPLGYVDRQGNVHRQGVMRLATAMDEIIPLRDVRVRNNEAYLVVLLLSRVILKLGDLPAITTEIVENFFAADLAYLQEFYRRINEQGSSRVPVVCPHCQGKLEVDLSSLGGVS